MNPEYKHCQRPSIFYTSINIRKIKFIAYTSSFNGSNTDGSFTTAVSNSFLGPLEQIP